MLFFFFKIDHIYKVVRESNYGIISPQNNARVCVCVCLFTFPLKLIALASIDSLSVYKSIGQPSPNEGKIYGSVAFPCFNRSALAPRYSVSGEDKANNYPNSIYRFAAPSCTLSFEEFFYRIWRWASPQIWLVGIQTLWLMYSHWLVPSLSPFDQLVFAWSMPNRRIIRS